MIPRPAGGSQGTGRCSGSAEGVVVLGAGRAVSAPVAFVIQAGRAVHTPVEVWGPRGVGGTAVATALWVTALGALDRPALGLRSAHYHCLLTGCARCDWVRDR